MPHPVRDQLPRGCPVRPNLAPKVHPHCKPGSTPMDSIVRLVCSLEEYDHGFSCARTRVVDVGPKFRIDHRRGRSRQDLSGQRQSSCRDSASRSRPAPSSACLDRTAPASRPSSRSSLRSRAVIPARRSSATSTSTQRPQQVRRLRRLRLAAVGCRSRRHRPRESDPPGSALRYQRHRV